MRRPRRLRSIALLGVACFVLIAPVAASASPTVIRTGGPSAPADFKVAIVASDRDLAGAGFQVVSKGAVVLRGHLRRVAGSAAPWAHAFSADLSRLRAPGRYRVRAAGRVSRGWVVRAGASSRTIDRILRFFRANRDGGLPALLHAPSHLNDATVKGGPHGGEHIDMTGGWMDAGDQLHFTQNAAYVTAVLEAAARVDPRDAPKLDAEADVGVNWLLKAHPYPGLFVIQVGDARDHERAFSDPAKDDGSGLAGLAHRFAYHWGDGVGGDIGGKAATALALAADRSTGSRRDTLLAAAEQWYAAGRKAGQPTPEVINPFYALDTWRDSMAAGAAALYRSTGRSSYLRDALAYLRRSQASDLLGYSNMTPFAAGDVCGRLGAPAPGDRAARREGCRALRVGALQALAYARSNAFGQAGYFTWGTTATDTSGGAQALLARLRSGGKVAAGARDYLLGRNPWGASFVAGIGPRSPRNIHSWASVFGDGLPDGAVVGGPAPVKQIHSQSFRLGGPLARFNSATVAYEDRRVDYVTSEPTIDSAANSILLLAELSRPF